jgi:DUF4097 and DUF4098 domain-containing protein YvlB
MTEVVMEKTFPISGKARVELSNIRGTVVVTSGSEAQIHVLAVKHTDDGNAENTDIIMDQRGEGTVFVETKFQAVTGWFSGRKPCKVDYSVSVPIDCEIKLSGVSCSFRVEGEQGAVLVRTVSGPVSLLNLKGVFEVDGVSADISISNLDGDLFFKTVSGDLDVRESNLKQVRGSTVSGDVSIQSPTSEGPYELRSVSGNVRLFLPDGYGCTVRKSSISGRLKTNMPVDRSRLESREQSVDIQGGGPVIRFSSISGDIFVNSSGEAADRGTRAPKEHSVKEEEPERLEILELIESGQISVEEGIERLNSL